jgi:BioD-like phosphotransacetylase family protein
VERRLFIAATSQNDGKTTCSLGLFKAYQALGKSVGFIKPVGQRYVVVDGQQIDKDTVLLKKVGGLTCPLKDMSPIAVERNFTRKYLDDPDHLRPKLERKITAAFAAVAKNNDLIIVEGTGHAGVGSVFDLGNARVASLLNAQVVIVTPGGIGRAMDEIMINWSLFEKEGVPVIGVIANKVLPDKLAQTCLYLSKALARKGLPMFGCIPYVPRLTWPTVQHMVEILKAEVLNGRERLSHEVADSVIGAMTPHNALKYIHDKTLLIVPGDRDDVVLAALMTDLLQTDMELSGIVLTGGLMLGKHTLDLISRTQIPVLAVKKNTYETAATIREVSVKIRDTDKEKIQLATALVRKHVNFKKILAAL